MREAPRNRWSTWALRACLIYYLLYGLPHLLSMLPGVSGVGEWWGTLLDGVAHWMIIAVLGLPEHSPTPPAWYLDHRGDSLAELVGCVATVTIALIASTAWTAMRTGNTRDERRYAWLDALVRFTFAGIMLSYGWAKILPQQFNGGQVPPSWLLWRVGDLSPQHLLWILMGFSRPYAIFSGAAEMVGALLVCSRRTATLGALLSTGVLSNVVMMNMAYDVPVKVFAANLLLMAIFIAARDADRLKAFVLGRPVPAVPPPPRLVGSKRLGRVAAVGLTFWLLIRPLPDVADNIGGLRLGRRPSPAYGGVFEVQQPEDVSKSTPSNWPPAANWRRVVLTGRSAVVRTDTDSEMIYRLAADSGTGRLTFTGPDPNEKTVSFRYSMPDPAHLLLVPKEQDTVRLLLRRTDMTLLRWRHFWRW